MPETLIMLIIAASLFFGLTGLLVGMVIGVKMNSEGDCSKMRKALVHAAKVFRLYARLHNLKGTPESLEKAKRNIAMAEECEEALK